MKFVPSWSEEKPKMSALRNKVEAERYAFIQKWCSERGLCHKISENWDKGAIVWAGKNCFNAA